MEAPPDDADIVGARPQFRPDWVLREHAKAPWQPQPTWLANPANVSRVEPRDDADVFTVSEAHRGMKWVTYFDAPVQTAGYRYLSLRIRGTGTIAEADYAVAVLGDAAGGGMDYTVLAPSSSAVTGPRWRRLDLPLPPATKHPRLVGLAVQAQAGDEPATLEIADVRLTSRRRPLTLSDLVFTQPGWPAGAAKKWAAVDIGPAANMTVDDARTRFRLADWFGSAQLRVEKMPFRIRLSGKAVAANAVADESEIVVPLSGRASGIYLLALARLTGDEEQLRGGGRLMRLDDVDRLRVTVRYADGTERRALPARIPAGAFGVEDGAQVLAVRADPKRMLKELRLYIGTRQAVIGIAGVTLALSAREALCACAWEPETPVAPQVRQVAATLPNIKPSARIDGKRLILANRYLRAEFDLAHGAALTRLVHQAIKAQCAATGGRQPLFDIRVGDKPVPPEAFALTASTPLEDTQGFVLTYRCASPALEVVVSLGIRDEPRVICGIDVRNISGIPRGQPPSPRLRSPGETARPQEMTITPSGPHLPLAIGNAKAMWYLIPASATVLSDRRVDYGGWYSGAEVSLQFLDAYNPQSGGGVCMMVRDLDSLEKRYQLRKSDAGVAMELTYQQRLLAPGETYALAPVDLRVHTGDWHQAFEAYRQWARTWYKPAGARPRWWREVFNFRQRFLYWLDPMYDSAARQYRMDAALDEAEREFGGCEYLHIFDWGNCGPYGRIYGRTGDYDPGDYLPGGWDGFRAAVEQVRQRGVRVGYYIEGYLLDERGKLGVAHGREWQMTAQDGSGMRWPNSTEIYVCPAVTAWQEVQASTYRRTVERMNADGMYLDELGFAGPWKWCWSKSHGHRSPGSSLQAEQALTKRVREAMTAAKPEAVLYTEDTPTDFNSQYQDGAFCYSMTRHRGSGSAAPLKLFRYAFPDFKNIEILNCDNPTGSWAAGVRWAFWNGEALWLEGKADEWFAPQTRRAIRECHRVLREHRDAFAGDRAEPLVPTLFSEIYANKFEGAHETAFTIYNARKDTFAGEAIAVTHRAGTRYFDAFAEREIKPRVSGGKAYLALSVDPEGVACITCETNEGQLPTSAAEAAQAEVALGSR